MCYALARTVAKCSRHVNSAMSIILRPYQSITLNDVRQAFRSYQSVLLVSPTGSGKTCIFAEITRSAMAKGKRVLILAHRAELVQQISSALSDFAVPHGFIAAGYPTRHAPVQVASVATLVRRLDSLPLADLLIQDEAHHVVAGNTWGKILAAYPRARLLGVTATPLRLDGHGLGAVFKYMVLGPTTRQLIEGGYLAPLRVFAPSVPDTTGVTRRTGDFATGELVAVMDKPAITGDAITHYERLAPGKRAIVFCVSVQHAQDVCAQFTAAGHRAQSVDGQLSPDVRRMRIDLFKSGEYPVMTSCDLVSEGFDLPAIECGISLRPTQSVGLWLQQIGRCLRTYPGKSTAIILDHAGNSLRHGLPTDDREWSLADGYIDKRPKSTDGVKICMQCFYANSTRARICESCGHAFPVKPREIDRRDGELTEITSGASTARMNQGQLQTLNDLIAEGKRRGYRSPLFWAKHVMAGREKKRRA